MTENKIKKFIEENQLSFTDTGSSLNGNIVIICGYACFLELNEEEFINLFANAIRLNDKDWEPILTKHLELEKELRRVFFYADYAYYGDWWKNEDAHSMYKF